MPRCPELNNDPAVEGKRSRIWPRNVIRMQAFHAARFRTGKFACFFKKIAHVLGNGRLGRAVVRWSLRVLGDWVARSCRASP